MGKQRVGRKAARSSPLSSIREDPITHSLPKLDTDTPVIHQICHQTDQLPDLLGTKLVWPKTHFTRKLSSGGKCILHQITGCAICSQSYGSLLIESALHDELPELLKCGGRWACNPNQWNVPYTIPTDIAMIKTDLAQHDILQSDLYRLVTDIATTKREQLQKIIDLPIDYTKNAARTLAEQKSENEAFQLQHDLLVAVFAVLEYRLDKLVIPRETLLIAALDQKLANGESPISITVETAVKKDNEGVQPPPSPSPAFTKDIEQATATATATTTLELPSSPIRSMQPLPSPLFAATTVPPSPASAPATPKPLPEDEIRTMILEIVERRVTHQMKMKMDKKMDVAILHTKYQVRADAERMFRRESLMTGMIASKERPQSSHLKVPAPASSPQSPPKSAVSETAVSDSTTPTTDKASTSTQSPYFSSLTAATKSALEARFTTLVESVHQLASKAVQECILDKPKFDEVYNEVITALHPAYTDIELVKQRVHANLKAKLRLMTGPAEKKVDDGEKSAAAGGLVGSGGDPNWLSGRTERIRKDLKDFYELL